MPRFVRRLLLLSVVCAGAAFGQSVAGTFAQVAFGGPWQTSFTLINLDSTNLGSVTLSFFGDNGAPITAPVQGFGNTAAYTFTIPPSGSANVVLANPDPNSTVTQGWATLTVVSGTVRGQGSFRFLLSNGQVFEAVVPLSTSGSAVCIIPFPPSSNPVLLIPFDNTGGYNTSIAIANLTNAQISIPIEFDDQANHQLKTDTIVLPAMGHTALTLATKYPAQLPNTKGVIRISQSTSNITVLGLLSNPTFATTTIIPISQ